MALELYRGVTYPATYYHTDANNNKLPLTGCTVFFTIKPVSYDDDTADSTATFKTSATVTDALNGIANWEVLIPRVGVEPGKKYYADIIVQDSSGKQLPPVYYSSVQIKTKVTNRTS